MKPLKRLSAHGAETILNNALGNSELQVASPGLARTFSSSRTFLEPRSAMAQLSEVRRALKQVSTSDLAISVDR